MESFILYKKFGKLHIAKKTEELPVNSSIEIIDLSCNYKKAFEIAQTVIDGLQRTISNMADDD